MSLDESSFDLESGGFVSFFMVSLLLVKPDFCDEVIEAEEVVEREAEAAREADAVLTSMTFAKLYNL